MRLSHRLDGRNLRLASEQRLEAPRSPAGAAIMHGWRWEWHARYENSINRWLLFQLCHRIAELAAAEAGEEWKLKG
jgi:hypothetical protein